MQKAVDIIWQWIPARFVAGKPHLSIHIDVEHAAGRTLQLHVFRATLLKFRPDTQGLGFMASGATKFDQDRHAFSADWIEHFGPENDTAKDAGRLHTTVQSHLFNCVIGS
jgi:hypothetical protein